MKKFLAFYLFLGFISLAKGLSDFIPKLPQFIDSKYQNEICGLGTFYNPDTSTCEILFGINEIGNLMLIITGSAVFIIAILIKKKLMKGEMN